MKYTKKRKFMNILFFRKTLFQVPELMKINDEGISSLENSRLRILLISQIVTQSLKFLDVFQTPSARFVRNPYLTNAP